MKHYKFRAPLVYVFLWIVLVGSNLFLVSRAFADQCAAQCYAQENACRKATNDDPKCGVELTKCLQACRGK